MAPIHAKNSPTASDELRRDIDTVSLGYEHSRASHFPDTRHHSSAANDLYFDDASADNQRKANDAYELAASAAGSAEFTRDQRIIAKRIKIMRDDRLKG